MPSDTSKVLETWEGIDSAFLRRDIKEYESYKDVPCDMEKVAMLASPQLIPLFIEQGITTFDEMVDANSNYKDFTFYLEKEWPNDRVKEYVITLKREQYANAANYILELERKNRDARAAGMSFKEREEQYGKKIRTGHKVLITYKEEGLEMKKQEYSVGSLVTPLDMGSIQKEGFGKHIKYAVF